MNEARRATFTDFVTDPKNEHLKLVDVIVFLNDAALYDWAVHVDLTRVPTDVQCLAVGHVYTATDSPKKIPESVSRIFDEYDERSGSRLAIFVWYAPQATDRERLTAAIRRLLRDDTVEEAMFWLSLRDRMTFIKEHIDVDTLGLSPSQRARYDRLAE